eukprot:TRINITY_DN1829_c0_g1_i1.p1 TRINITY_DN1829_c0_g1~~TRINITY_DN1829_c0_g1_i1.p1  ORF type:complete len:330 (-),score=69.19 TRINITY_DN1829_c0_g1_i1:61-1050(-)
MKVVITGGLGFLGSKLAEKLLEKGSVVGIDGSEQPIKQLVLFDIASRTDLEILKDPRVSIVVGNISDKSLVEKLVDTDHLSVFHLSSIMSGQGEDDFDLALNVNLDGTRNLLECIRKKNSKIRLVFTSTCAIFDSQDLVTDSTRLLPRTTYGTTKACCEMLINDYTRKGFMDGRIARLPTVVVRPGKPNGAASSFCSGIFREPLNGEDMVVPVEDDVPVFLIGYPSVIENLIRLHELPSDQFGYDRTVILPGFSATVKDMIQSVTRVAKEVFPDKKMGKIEIKVDPKIAPIVRSWPKDGYSANAERLKLSVDKDLDGIIKHYIKDFMKK